MRVQGQARVLHYHQGYRALSAAFAASVAAADAGVSGAGASLPCLRPLPLPHPLCPPLATNASACTPVFVGFGLVWAGIYNPPPPAGSGGSAQEPAGPGAAGAAGPRGAAARGHEGGRGGTEEGTRVWREAVWRGRGGDTCVEGGSLAGAAERLRWWLQGPAHERYAMGEAAAGLRNVSSRTHAHTHTHTHTHTRLGGLWFVVLKHIQTLSLSFSFPLSRTHVHRAVTSSWAAFWSSTASCSRWTPRRASASRRGEAARSREREEGAEVGGGDGRGEGEGREAREGGARAVQVRAGRRGPGRG